MEEEYLEFKPSLGYIARPFTPHTHKDIAQ
jgi:hypothetical protein